MAKRILHAKYIMKAREVKGGRGFECVDSRTRNIKANIFRKNAKSFLQLWMLWRVITANVLKRHVIQKICLANHWLITTLPADEWQQKSYELLLTFIGVFELVGKRINQFLLRLNIRLTGLFRLGWQQVNEKNYSEFKLLEPTPLYPKKCYGNS